MRTKKNADQPRFFRRRKRTRLASRSNLGGSSRCHNRCAFLALTDVGVVLNSSILQDMAKTTMKQARIIATIKKCRIPYVEIPIQEQTPKAQPYLESGLKRNLLLYRYGKAKTPGNCIGYRYKRRFTPPSPIWKVATRKVNLLWYRHRNRHVLPGVPIQEKIPATQSYLESGGAKGESTLVSTRQSTMYRCARAMRIQEEIPVAQSYLESGNDER